MPSGGEAETSSLTNSLCGFQRAPQISFVVLKIPINTRPWETGHLMINLSEAFGNVYGHWLILGLVLGVDGLGCGI